MAAPCDIARIFRAEAGRALATLIRLVGDFDRAEEALQDAFALALEKWPAEGAPDNPRAWLVHVARNKTIDRARRAAQFRDKTAAIVHEIEIAASACEPAADESGFEDDLLRLIFTCAHPALAMEARVALTLRTVCGLRTEAVGRAFLVSEEAMAQRLVRAKAKIREARIPYVTPDATMLPERLDGVLAVIYLVFTEGHAASEGEAFMKPELCEEAIRLARLVDALLPGRAGVTGLLALMLLHHARRAARADADGEIVRLEEQDRSLWKRDEIAHGLPLVEAALRALGPPHPYAVQAAIAALHVQAPSFRETDWRQIAGLYEVLVRIAPSPIVELNRAAALSRVDGPARALDLVDALAARHPLETYALLPATRADLLTRLGRIKEARAAYDAAIALSKLAPERRLFERRKGELGST